MWKRIICTKKMCCLMISLQRKILVLSENKDYKLKFITFFQPPFQAKNVKLDFLWSIPFWFINFKMSSTTSQAFVYVLTDSVFFFANCCCQIKVNTKQSTVNKKNRFCRSSESFAWNLVVSDCSLLLDATATKIDFWRETVHSYDNCTFSNIFVKRI